MARRALNIAFRDLDVHGRHRRRNGEHQRDHIKRFALRRSLCFPRREGSSTPFPTVLNSACGAPASQKGATPAPKSLSGRALRRWSADTMDNKVGMPRHRKVEDLGPIRIQTGERVYDHPSGPWQVPAFTFPPNMTSAPALSGGADASPWPKYKMLTFEKTRFCKNNFSDSGRGNFLPGFSQAISQSDLKNNRSSNHSSEPRLWPALSPNGKKKIGVYASMHTDSFFTARAGS